MRLHNLRRGDINFDYNMLQNEIKTLTNELKSLENNHIENTNKENINNEDNVNTIPDDSDDDSSSQNNESYNDKITKTTKHGINAADASEKISKLKKIFK